MRREQAARLRASELPTLTSLAQAAAAAPPGMAANTFETLRDQARLLFTRRTENRLDRHPLRAETGCGFELVARLCGSTIARERLAGALLSTPRYDRGDADPTQVVLLRAHVPAVRREAR